MACAETLGYFHKDTQTQVIANASPVGLGAVLTQKQKNGPRVICYASRSLTDTEEDICRQRKRCWCSYGPAKRSIPMCRVCHLISLQITSHWKLLTAQGQNPAHALKDGCYECSHTKFKVKYEPGPSNIADPLSRLVGNLKTSSSQSCCSQRICQICSYKCDPLCYDYTRSGRTLSN